MFNYSIMAMDEAHIEEICQDVKRQYDDGVSSMVLFIFTLVPEGNPVIPKAEIMVEKYVKFRDRLAEMGIECGILAQCTIGHGYKLSTKFPFQGYEGLSDGGERYVACPCDQGFMDYIEHAFEVMASVKPAEIMVDDDFRLMNRPQHGCACPLHLKVFEKEYGAPLTRQEIFAATRANDEESKRITDCYVKTQIDSLVTAAKAMRRGIDKVDKTIKGSFCACGNAAEGAAEIAEILAGEGNPVLIRVNNGYYTPAGARNLTSAFQRAAIQMTVMKSQGKIDGFLAETDTCPQNRYSTSAASLHAHFTGTIIEGAMGAKHWISKTNEFQPRAGVAYRKKLSENANFYETLSKEVQRVKWLGCRIPLSTVPDYNFTENPAAMSNWSLCCLERLGLPMYFSAENGGAVFMDGNMPSLFTDDELKEMLSGTVFLDGYAARSIQERGFGKYLGVTVSTWKGATAMKELIGEEKKRVSVQLNSLGLAPAEGAIPESIVCDEPDGKTFVPLYPGSVYFENELGGKVVTFCGSIKTPFNYNYFSFLDESRKRQLVNLLARCGHMPVYYPDDAEVYLRAARHSDGSLFVSFFNIGLDGLDELPLCVDGEVESVEILNKNGERQPVDFAKDGNRITVAHALPVLDIAILYIKTK